MLCAVGPIWLVSEVGDAYAGLRSNGRPPAGAVWAAWAGNWVWVPALCLVGIFLLLLFPDGHLPSRRWRPVVWSGAFGTVLTIVSTAVDPARLEGGHANPLGTSGQFAELISASGLSLSSSRSWLRRRLSSCD
jgi:hypothetical protein